ncbi:MAG: Bacteriophage repressor helix-turn-helix domain [Pseudomonadota bacterium]|jgi:transcriptional regulator with XRE-family HTH domain
MRKTVKRTFLDRALEAYRERYKDKATQAKVAALVGKKQPSAAEWGQPGRFPEMGAVTELAEKLGVAVEWLLTERGPKHVPPVDKDAQALWTLWPRLDELGRARVVAYAETRVDEGEDGSGSSVGAHL